MVYGLFLVETTQTILITHDGFNAYVISFGNLAALNEMQNEWLAVPVFGAIGKYIFYLPYLTLRISDDSQLCGPDVLRV